MQNLPLRNVENQPETVRTSETGKNPAGITLTEHQHSALNMLKKFLNKETGFSMALLEGHAGTGKTTLVGELVGYFAGQDRRIAIAAPTNKAVRVLKEKVEAQTGLRFEQVGDWNEGAHKVVEHPMEYGSIHSFLGLRLNEREDGSQECRQESDPTTHKYSLVIVDECSMLGADLFERISISKRNALVLFVGDPAQLPPVGDLDEVSQVFARVTYRVTLTEIVRQAESNPIIRLSIAIRKAMERNEKVSLMTLGEALPVAFPAKAGIMQGGTAAALSALLYEIEQGRDARILAFTNNAVLAYNAGAHRALHGATVHPFVAGERAIAHQPFDAQSLDKDNEPAGLTMVINSEELLIESITAGTHYIYRDQYPCCRVVLKRDSGERVACWIANDRDQVDRDICALFSEWRKLKLAAQAAERRGDRDADKLRRDAAEMSGKAWALRKTFAPLRHAYAMTTHKSQGSTFDTAIVDFNDMNRMRSPMQFNRGLYVAITRPREHLAIIV